MNKNNVVVKTDNRKRRLFVLCGLGVLLLLSVF